MVSLWYEITLSEPELKIQSNLTIRKHNLQDDILVYGGSGAGEKQPDHVAGKWSVATEFLKEGARTVHSSLLSPSVACTSGTLMQEMHISSFLEWLPN